MVEQVYGKGMDCGGEDRRISATLYTVGETRRLAWRLNSESSRLLVALLTGISAGKTFLMNARFGALATTSG